MDYNFTDLMSKKTDEELITLLSARRDEYSEAALDAAQNEFDKREISLEKIETVKVEQTVIKEKESANANEPLEKEIKRLAIVFPLIARLMYAEKFRKEGYDRKLEEMANAYFYGRLLLVGLIILIVIIAKMI